MEKTSHFLMILTPLRIFFMSNEMAYIWIFFERSVNGFDKMSFLLKLNFLRVGARSSPTFLSKKCYFNEFFVCLFVYFSGGINFVCCFIRWHLIYFLTKILSGALFFKKNVLNFSFSNWYWMVFLMLFDLIGSFNFLKKINQIM